MALRKKVRKVRKILYQKKEKKIQKKKILY